MEQARASVSGGEGVTVEAEGEAEGVDTDTAAGTGAAAVAARGEAPEATADTGEVSPSKLGRIVFLLRTRKCT